MPGRVSRVVTAADVQHAADCGLPQLVVARGCAVTPLALDTARERGIALVRTRDGERVEARAAPHPVAGAATQAVAAQAVAAQAAAGAGDDSLEAKVRRIVTALVATSAAPATSSPEPGGGPVRGGAVTGASGVVHVGAGTVGELPLFPYPGPPPGQTVRAKDVVTSAHGAPVAAGFLTLTQGSFPWTLTYDEVQYVIEGELHLGTTDGVIVGRPGDVLFVPRGSAITFGTPSWAKLLYVTYPADWEASVQ